MFMDFISNDYGNQPGNSGKKQVRVKCFFVLRFTPGNTKAVFQMVNGFFHIYAYFISGIPFLCTTDGSGIGTKILLWVDVDHSSAGRSCTRIITMAYAF